MKLLADVTIEDHVAFQRHLQTQSPTLRQARRSLFAAIPCILLAASGSAAMMANSWTPIVAGGIASVAFTVGYYRHGESTYLDVIDKQMRRVFDEARNVALVGLHEFEITEEAIIERSKHHESVTRWSAVENIAETLTHVFIYRCATDASVIPKSGLDRDDVRRFVVEARRIHDAHANAAASA